MLFLYGVRSSIIESYLVHLGRCASCNESANYRVTITGHYFHFFFVPVFPLWKSTVAECQQCRNLLKPKSYFPELQKSVYQHFQNNKIVKRPWWHSLGIIIIAGAVLLATILVVVAISMPEPGSNKSFEELAYEQFLDDKYDTTSDLRAPKDSISFNLRNCLESSLFQGAEIPEMYFATRIFKNRLLIIIEDPNLIDMQWNDRKKYVEIIEKCLDEDLAKSYDKYIFIETDDGSSLISTPNQTATFELTEDYDGIYDFYKNYSFQKQDEFSETQFNKIEETNAEINSLEYKRSLYSTDISDSDLLSNIIYQSTADPDPEKQELTYELKNCFDYSDLYLQRDQTEFTYVTNKEKLLIIARFPDIEKVVFKDRYKLINKVEECILKMNELEFQEFYIAIDGYKNIMAV